MEALTEAALEGFPWQSEAQKEGFLSLIQFWNNFDVKLTLPLSRPENLTAMFFIQKDHESNEYWRDMVGDQFSSLENQVKMLQEQSKNMSSLVEQLQLTIKAQSQTIDLLTKRYSSVIEGAH